jgi:preprotein translocase subunit SecY
MPVIFASSLLMLPYFLFSMITNAFNTNWSAYLASEFVRQGYVYNLFNIALIFFFTYFWTGIAFNPKEVSNNLRDYGSFIPGYRPGRRTGEYLEKVMNRLTFVGAAFLCVVAIMPSIITATMPQVDPLIASFYGGTGLLILISVSLDLVQKINSHLVMRNYPGLTED